MATNDVTGGGSPGSSGETSPVENGVVTLTIPCAPEYVGTARLTILGVASRMGFSYDQIEDIRLAVGEACANAIERSGGGRSSNGSAAAAAATESLLTIRSLVDASKLIIEVEDEAVEAPPEPDPTRPAGEVDFNSHELGALLMEILVDEVSVDTKPNGGSCVRLVKYVDGNE